ncbi:MAG: C-GCAxxG-C-C family protein [Clostridia bacterium]
MNRRDIATDLFKQGYNCCQAVICAFDDVLKLDKEFLIKLSSAFGGGFARTRNLCGAISAIGMVVGLVLEQETDPEKIKTTAYEVTQQLLNKFKEKNCYLNCGELLKNVKNITSNYVPDARTEEYYKKRPCVKFVGDSAEILEQFLKEKGLLQ